jgi:hypothetical protein
MKLTDGLDEFRPLFGAIPFEAPAVAMAEGTYKHVWNKDVTGWILPVVGEWESEAHKEFENHFGKPCFATG